MRRVLLVALSLGLALWAALTLFDRPEVTNPHPTGETIICFGDSLTAGTGAGRGQSYPAQLARLLGEPVVNRGVPGDTTADALARLEA